MLFTFQGVYVTAYRFCSVCQGAVFHTWREVRAEIHVMVSVGGFSIDFSPGHEGRRIPLLLLHLKKSSMFSDSTFIVNLREFKWLRNSSRAAYTMEP